MNLEQLETLILREVADEGGVPTEHFRELCKHRGVNPCLFWNDGLIRPTYSFRSNTEKQTITAKGRAALEAANPIP